MIGIFHFGKAVFTIIFLKGDEEHNTLYKLAPERYFENQGVQATVRRTPSAFTADVYTV